MVVVVTLLTYSSVIVIVLVGAVTNDVEVAHLLLSNSVMVTVLLSRPRFSMA